jgi:hypothetical protein
MKDESFDTAEEMTRLLQDPRVQQDLDKKPPPPKQVVN